MELLRFFAMVIGAVLVLIDLFFLSKLLRSAKDHQWEKAEHSCNVMLVLFPCVLFFAFLATFLDQPFFDQYNYSFAGRLGLSLLKMIGTVWPFAVANAFIIPTFRKKIRDGQESHTGTEEDAEHMGANFEIEIVSEKFISKTAVAAFLQNIGIHGELKRGAVISNWNYEDEHEIPLRDSAIEDAVLKGHIVLADGETPDGIPFGSIFHRNVDTTFTSSIWFRLALRRKLDGYHGKEKYDSALNAIINELSVLYSFSPILIAMGTEIGFDYKGSVPDAIAESIGVQKWMVRQEDGSFIWKDGGTVLP